MMTDAFKNLVIEVKKDAAGKPVSIVLPISGKTLGIEYNEKGGVSNVTGVDMSSAIGAVAVDSSIYTVGEDGALLDGEKAAPIQMGAKVIGQNGKVITFDFDEVGRLRSETNEKFTSHYFLKEPVNFGPMCTQRLSTVYGNSAVIVRELKDPVTGVISYEESVFANVITVSESL